MTPIPIVSADHILAAHNKVIEDRERYGWSDITVSVSLALLDKLSPREILDVLQRLHALKNFQQAAEFFGPGELLRQLTDMAGEGFVLTDEALVLAAARAPAFADTSIRDAMFNKNSFLLMVLEESKAANALDSGKPSLVPSDTGLDTSEMASRPRRWRLFQSSGGTTAGVP